MADVHGERALEVIRKATAVDLGLIEKSRKRRVTTWVRVDPWTASALARIFLTPESYDFADPPLCGPTPRVAVRFLHEKEEALVKLCFQCNVALGEVGWGDLDPVRDRLAEIVRQHLPRDAHVPGL